MNAHTESDERARLIASMTQEQRELYDACLIEIERILYDCEPDLSKLRKDGSITIQAIWLD